MVKESFLNEDKSILIYTCDNLGEYFAEFAKYRKAASESDDWDKGFNKFYGERVQAFIEDYGTDFTYRKKIKELEKEISELKEQLKKETNNKTVLMVISIAVVSVFILILFFGWLKIKKLKKH